MRIDRLQGVGVQGLELKRFRELGSRVRVDRVQGVGVQGFGVRPGRAPRLSPASAAPPCPAPVPERSNLRFNLEEKKRCGQRDHGI